jgi:transposase-like protein
MLVCGSLRGLPDSVAAFWPQTVVQTCEGHLLCKSFAYAGRQDWSKIAKDLKPVHTAPTEAAAFDRFAEFSEKWEHKYPAIVRLWTNAWAEFGPGYDVEIRKEELVGPDWPLT